MTGEPVTWLGSRTTTCLCTSFAMMTSNPVWPTNSSVYYGSSTGLHLSVESCVYYSTARVVIIVDRSTHRLPAFSRKLNGYSSTKALLKWRWRYLQGRHGNYVASGCSIDCYRTGWHSDGKQPIAKLCHRDGCNARQHFGQCHLALKWKCRHFDEIFIVFDNFRCSQWRNSVNKTPFPFQWGEVMLPQAFQPMEARLLFESTDAIGRAFWS